LCTAKGLRVIARELEVAAARELGVVAVAEGAQVNVVATRPICAPPPYPCAPVDAARIDPPSEELLALDPRVREGGEGVRAAGSALEDQRRRL
jgi:hypothetical protein